MKKVLLSLLLLGSVSTLFAQTPCPVGVGAGTNNGGGDCKKCEGSPNVPGSDFSKGTAKIVLDFGNQDMVCIPRLLRLTGQTGDFRVLTCGVGQLKKGGGNNSTLIEYCIFGTNDDPFFKNKAYVTATIKYDCVGVERVCPLEGVEEAPLPVTFSSFNVNRKNASSASIKWTTASEQNNRGFNVQRNDGSGWKTVAFVFSKSVAGTSSSDLSYEYNDANMERGVSQYRIQQLDLDGRSAFSVIRAIRGDGVAAKMLVYPNPSATGNINVLFDSNFGIRDIMVSDAAGRLVRSFRSITNNNLQIENLKRGFYTIKITNRTTASSSVEKVIVK